MRIGGLLTSRSGAACSLVFGVLAWHPGTEHEIIVFHLALVLVFVAVRYYALGRDSSVSLILLYRVFSELDCGQITALYRLVVSECAALVVVICLLKATARMVVAHRRALLLLLWVHIEVVAVDALLLY